MASKEDILRDINIITTLSSKYDLTATSHIDKILKFLDEKKPFKTQLGTLYCSRLKQIKSGNTQNACLLCKKQSSYDEILCDDCMSKYTKGTKIFYKKAELNSKTDKTAEGVGSQLKDAVDMAKTKANELQDKISSRLKEEDVQNAKAQVKEKAIIVKNKAEKFAKDNNLDEKAEIAKKKSRIIFRRLSMHWHNLSRKQQLIVSAIGIVILLVLLGGGRASKFGRKSAAQGEVVSTESGEGIDVCLETDNVIRDIGDAEKLLWKYFPEKEGWNILSESESVGFRGDFWPPVGRTSGYAEQIASSMSTPENNYVVKYYEKESHYTFVISNGKTGECGYIFINGAGRMLKRGEFNDLPLKDENFRIL